MTAESDRFGGTLRCPVGEMQLSHVTYEKLTALVAGARLESSVRANAVRWGVGGKWFCPRDAERVVEREGRVACPRCGLDLTRSVYELIEMHWHRSEKDLHTPAQ